MKTKPNQHGGKRPNAGAKPKYNEPTKTVSFRIPISKVQEIKDYINFLLSKLKSPGANQ